MATTELEVQRKLSSRAPLVCAYGIEALTSISVNLFMNGIAFYMNNEYHWPAGKILLLMMIQGMVYALAAVGAGKLAARFSKAKTLLVSQILLLLLLIPMSMAQSALVLVPLLLASAMVSTLTWPLAESMVTGGCEPSRMSRRITIYNLTWSCTAGAVIAVYGTILYYWPRGPMVLPVITQALSVALALILWRNSRETNSQSAHHAEHAATELLAVRKLALWLARISLPASFIIANSLMGIFASLPASREMGVQLSTLVASLWMVGRIIMFIILGATTWWHTRPRLLLAAATILLLAFLGIIIPAQRVGPFASGPLSTIIAAMVIAELILGLMAGFIFSGSLYFGMVLSDGSAEQGGYHEGLIGVGMVLGPGLAAAAQQFAPENSQWPGILTVCAVMLLTLLLSTWVTLSMRHRTA